MREIIQMYSCNINVVFSLIVQKEVKITRPCYIPRNLDGSETSKILQTDTIVDSVIIIDTMVDPV